jgi:hypothetical protein
MCCINWFGQVGANPMEQSPSSRADSFSSHSPYFVETEGSLPSSKQPYIIHVLGQVNTAHGFAPWTFNINFNIILLFISIFQVAFFGQVSPPIPCMHVPFPVHATPSRLQKPVS